MELKLIQRGQSNMASDYYKVVGVKSPCTFSDFINMVLSEYPAEWGDIHLRKCGDNLTTLEYKNGKINYDMGEAYRDALIDVNNIHADSSWGRCCYYVEILGGYNTPRLQDEGL